MDGSLSNSEESPLVVRRAQGLRPANKRADEMFKAPSIFKTALPSYNRKAGSSSSTGFIMGIFTYVFKVVFCYEREYSVRWASAGDMNALSALAMNTLTDLLLIISVGGVIGYSEDFINATLLPGVALATFAGNFIFYWMAAAETRRRGYCLEFNPDCIYAMNGNRIATAIPFGIATPSLIQWLFNLMLPLAFKYSPEEAFGAALAANCLSGLITIAASFPAIAKVVNYLPESASAAPLAGIGLSLISVNFLFQVFASPLIAVVPLFATILVFFVAEDSLTLERATIRREKAETRAKLRSGGYVHMNVAQRALQRVSDACDRMLISMIERFRAVFPSSRRTLSSENTQILNSPSNWPSALIIVAVFTLVAWVLKWCGNDEFKPASDDVHVSWYLTFYHSDTLSLLRAHSSWKNAWDNFSIILPLTFVNTLGSLNCIKMAQKCGDSYSQSWSIFWLGVVNVLSTLVSCPYSMTLYIGHGLYKNNFKAGPAYSLFNGLLILLIASLGVVTAIFKIVPQEILIASLVIVGVSIMKSAFEFSEDSYVEQEAEDAELVNKASSSGSMSVIEEGLVNPSGLRNVGQSSMLARIDPRFGQWTALQEYHKEHEMLFPAVIIGILPALANWALIIINNALSAGTSYSLSLGGPSLNLRGVFPYFGNSLFIDGVMVLAQGYLFTCILYASATTYCLRRQFGRASLCFVALGLLSWTGFVHTYVFDSDGTEKIELFADKYPTQFTYVYMASAVILLLPKVVDRVRVLASKMK
eukprot:ANDGO_05555.mRNA.1 hypothetical protein SARC_09563